MQLALLGYVLVIGKCTHCSGREPLEERLAHPSAPKFLLKCYPCKGQGCQSKGFLHISAGADQREVEDFLFPEPWCCPSDHLASAAVISHKGSLKAVFSVTLSLYSQLFPIFPEHCACQNQCGGETIRKSEHYSYFCLGLGKSQALSSILCVRKILGLRVIEQVVGVGVYVHHGCFILPALT